MNSYKYNNKLYMLIPFVVIAGILMNEFLVSMMSKQNQVSKNGNSGIERNNCENHDDILLEKPVIYLSGYEGKTVKVSLELDGHMKITYPSAELNGKKAVWEVKEAEDGKISVNGDEYRYLFWEGDTSYDFTFNKGFCVRGDDILTFLDNRLSEFKFTDQEKEDFITYWGPRMMDNPYNVISFQSKAYTDKAKLVVSPEPDVTLRVFMAWYPSDTFVSMTEQHFTVPSRSGKVVVEWGGCECKNPDAPDDTLSNNNGILFQESTTTQQSTSLQNSSISQVPADPYAQYGAYAKCAKDWDQTGARKSGRTWAQLDPGTQQAAYNHWITHGTNGW